MTRTAAIAAVRENPEQAADLMRQLINAVLHPTVKIEREDTIAARAAAFLGTPLPDEAAAMSERDFHGRVQ